MSGYALAFLSFLVFLVQSSVMPFFFSGLHQPDLWLVVIVLATLIFDNKTAMTLESMPPESPTTISVKPAPSA